MGLPEIVGAIKSAVAQVLPDDDSATPAAEAAEPSEAAASPACDPEKAKGVVSPNAAPVNMVHHHRVVARTTHKDVVACYDPAAPGVPSSCEVSTVGFFAGADGKSCSYVARNDKDNSKVEVFGCTDDGHIDPSKHLKRTPGFMHDKVEAMATSPSGKFAIFLSSGDRIDATFNLTKYAGTKDLLMTGKMKDLVDDGKDGQRPIRGMIIEYMVANDLVDGSIPGKTHFKIEAASVTEESVDADGTIRGKIYIGIRESAKEFTGATSTDHRVLFLVADYSYKPSKEKGATGQLAIDKFSKHIELTDLVQQKLVQMEMAEEDPSEPKIEGSLIGVGSAEYSPTDGRTYFTTTYEKDGAPLETYIWYMEPDADGSVAVSPLYDENGKMLKVEHKVEGLAIRTTTGADGKEKVVLVGTCDDDKVVNGERAINQAVVFEWTISEGAEEAPAIVQKVGDGKSPEMVKTDAR